MHIAYFFAATLTFILSLSVSVAIVAHPFRSSGAVWGRLFLNYETLNCTTVSSRSVILQQWQSRRNSFQSAKAGTLLDAGRRIR